MPLEPSDSLLTRASLLFRLRDWKDTASWEEFYRLYRKLIYGLARRSGLTHNEAEEVMQDVFKRVAETIHNFESHPKRGRFRAWLLNLVRWRVSDKFRARRPEEHPAMAGQLAAVSDAALMERMTDHEAGDRALWESEWQRNVLDAALARLARRVPAKQFQAFDLYALQRWPVLRVARDLGINPATVYLISHRLTRQLKVEVLRLKAQMG
jgi:RNA polymerase sigma-70 factor (ECF subfamily)